MLAIVDRVALAHLTACQKVDEAAVAHRPRLDADHRTQAHATLAGRPPGHRHQPVRTADLIVADPSRAVDRAGLVKKLDECRAVEHQRPRTDRAPDPEHRRLVRHPRRTRGLACGKRLRGRRIAVVLMLAEGNRSDGERQNSGQNRCSEQRPHHAVEDVTKKS